MSELKPRSIGHGYILGSRCTGYEAVRRARGSYTCEGCLVAADSLDSEELSPGTGSIIGEGRSDQCSEVITRGDLYVALDLTGEHATDFGGGYRCTYRTCLACALRLDTVRTADHVETKSGGHAEPMLRVKWYGRRKPLELPLGNVHQLKEAIDASTSYVAELTCHAVDFMTLTEILQPIADPELDEISINGVMVVVGTTSDGRSVFVPERSSPGVEHLFTSSASWLSGGPCVFEHRVEILRFGDLYWVNSSGDLDYTLAVVGRYETESEGIRAAVEASSYLELGPGGEVRCELDDWGHEE